MSDNPNTKNIIVSKGKNEQKQKIPLKYQWFYKAFNFYEISTGEITKVNYKCDYVANYQKFDEIKTSEIINGVNIIKINNINVGQFTILNTYNLNGMIKKTIGISKTNNKVNFQNILIDILELHKHPASNNVTIQVASQLNCLEMITSDVTPSDGITKYVDDRTQGPICAVATPAGLAYRNYLYKNKDGVKQNIKQINLLEDFIRLIKSDYRGKNINIDIINGYLFFHGPDDIKKMNIILKNASVRNTASWLIASGSHTGLGVCIDGTKYRHLVNHVYCSGIPIAHTYYGQKIHDIGIFDGISEILLDAMYLNTLLIGCINNYHNKTNKPCYLTKIGGGAFGMKHNYIITAIIRACNYIKKNGLSLDVKLVHHIKKDSTYDSINEYLNPKHSLKSIWENEEWIKKYAT